MDSGDNFGHFMYFRKNPFEGGFAIFAGLQDLLECLENFYFSEDDIHFLKKELLIFKGLKYQIHRK